MRRRIAQSFVLLCLMVSVSSLLVWGWSIYRDRVLGIASFTCGKWEIYVHSEGLTIAKNRGRINFGSGGTIQFIANFERAGIVYQNVAVAEVGGSRIWILPPWLISLSTALPSIWWLFRERKRRRLIRLRGKVCITCGYDLRESRERCPECGTAIRATP